jgi:hypothetical protein
MKNFLSRKVWPVFAGLSVAFLIMLVFEYINSLFYPLPENLDVLDPAKVRAFTQTLPWTAYILVFLGWVVGSFKAGCVTSYLAKDANYRLAFVTGALLTIAGIVNNMLIGHHILFNLIGLPMFILFTYLGHVYLRRVLHKRQQIMVVKK